MNNWITTRKGRRHPREKRKSKKPWKLPAIPAFLLLGAKLNDHKSVKVVMSMTNQLDSMILIFQTLHNNASTTRDIGSFSYFVFVPPYYYLRSSWIFQSNTFPPRVYHFAANGSNIKKTIAKVLSIIYLSLTS